jgi:hypothetical protein
VDIGDKDHEPHDDQGGRQVYVKVEDYVDDDEDNSDCRIDEEEERRRLQVCLLDGP